MNFNGKDMKLEEAAIRTAVVDVHCREQGINPSSLEGGEVASVVGRLADSGTTKPDDLRAALNSKAGKPLQRP